MSKKQNRLFLRRELISEDAFIADNATVIGDVTLGERASVWFGAVIRGDNERICVGNESNIQDNAVLHADADLPCLIGDRVTVGHAAIVHGAAIEPDVMIGMGAIILNGAKIQSGSVIAPGSVVTEGQVIPPNSIVMGVPGKTRRDATDSDFERIRHAYRHYVELAKSYAHRNQLR